MSGSFYIIFHRLSSLLKIKVAVKSSNSEESYVRFKFIQIYVKPLINAAISITGNDFSGRYELAVKLVA